MSELPEWARRGRAGWRYRGQERPPFAESPAPGQESVWDYPRPPRVVPDARRVLVRAGGQVVADTVRALRVLETASPPVFYVCPDDVRLELLDAGMGGSACEWKGLARYWSVRVRDREGGLLENAAWSYPEPFPEFAALRDWLSFYPARVACSVDGVAVRAQPGGFYGGWVTPELAGPFKGHPGSERW